MTKPNLLIDIHAPDLAANAAGGGSADATQVQEQLLLADALQDLGATVMFSHGPEAYDLKKGKVWAVMPPEGRLCDEPRVRGLAVSLRTEVVRAVRNTAAPIGLGGRELNHPDIRKMTTDRRAARQIMAAAGVVLSADEDLDLLPFNVRGEDDEQKDKLRAANAAGGAVLRTYVFGSDGVGRPVTSHVMRRAVQPGEQTDGKEGEGLIFIDQAHIPDTVVEGTQAITSRLEAAMLTSRPEVHIAIEWGRVRAADGEAVTVPLALLGDVPPLVSPSDNRRLAEDQAALLAQQLVRLAKNNMVM